MVNYFIEDYVEINDKPLLVRWDYSKLPQKYNFEGGKWIIDRSLCRINIGEIPVSRITEKEVEEIIKLNL